MKPKQETKSEADKLVRNIKRATRRKFSAEEKIRIVLAGLGGEDSIAELYRREGLHQNLYYRWSKEFFEAGKKRLAGDPEREASRDDVTELRKESAQLKAAPRGNVTGESADQKKRARDWGGRYMRYAASEKHEIIRTVEASSLGSGRTLRQLSIPKTTFYRWYDRYLTDGIEGLADKKPTPLATWHQVPEEIRQAWVEQALNLSDLSPRELAVRFTDDHRCCISEATADRILKEQDLVTSPAWIVLKAANQFDQPTTAINQLWQTDFTYLKVTGWGCYYLSTVMDDYSRYILAWRLCQTRNARDVTATLKGALKTAGLSKKQRPKLLSDNGPCYISAELQEWLKDHELSHTRGKPYHPMTQGKIERWHRSLKNRILLENYYLPEDLERQIGEFVIHYNTRRYHESLKNLTPEDVWYGRGQVILDRRRKLKEDTLKLRRQLYYERKTA